MLTDAKLQAISRNTDTVSARYADKDGLYAKVLSTGKISFRWDFYMGGRGGRRGTCTFGLYPDVSLKQARLMLAEAKKDVASGIDPSRKKVLQRKSFKSSGTFDEWWNSYLQKAQIAESTKQMKIAVYRRDLKKAFGNLKLSEIRSEDLRALCDKIVDRGAPSVAVHARDIVLQVFKWAQLRGEKVENPAENVPPTSIARFRPRERSLSPSEIGIALKCFDYVGANLAVKAGAKLLLLTFVRKSELSEAKWSEIDFEREIWVIPAERMKKKTAARRASVLASHRPFHRLAVSFRIQPVRTAQSLRHLPPHVQRDVQSLLCSGESYRSGTRSVTGPLWTARPSSNGFNDPARRGFLLRLDRKTVGT